MSTAKINTVTSPKDSKELCNNLNKVIEQKPPSPIALSVSLSETIARLHFLKKTGHVTETQVQRAKKIFK